ncbi:hypothetical protein LTR84_005780 [Exophiala bonariae]|uniref:Cytochrome P450 n=1 Tax=Exophiala bonariae TaxID=1690606 RepID=A0AAV9N3N3_9EURO|nr:hypothetical protein LTR84_005780 [Exophiala bonariae]
MDTFVQWQFGRSLGSNLIEDLAERKMYFDGFFSPGPYTFWQYYFPDLARVLRTVGIYLIPRWVDTHFKAIEDWNLDKCDRAQQLLARHETLAEADQPVVFEQALKSMSEVDSKPGAYPQRMEVASDMFAHNSAAFETSGNTETYFFYEMCRNPIWQKRLREELLTLEPQLKFEQGKKYEIEDLPSSKVVDALPILHAVIVETMRLYPSVPGGQPRVVPRPCTLGSFENIPKGTIVQSYAYALHRTPEIFPDPHQWKPERWLDASPEQLTVMKKWFWPFSSGGRMCIGSNFAYYSMKFLAAGVYTNYTTTIHDHGDMELQDSYLAGPNGHRLEVKFHSNTHEDAIRY